MITIDNAHSIGDIVYLKTDKEQSARIVTCIKVNKYDLIYEVVLGTIVSGHYDFELSTTVDILQSVT